MSEKQEGCVFCEALADEDGPQNGILHRGENAFVILNTYPYTNGHTMVLPYQHIPNLDDLDSLIRAEMFELVNHVCVTLRKVYHPEGFNIGINMGEAAGAGIGSHIHMHIVPRWRGDTNFMTAIGQTRVMPESLEETFRRVREMW